MSSSVAARARYALCGALIAWSCLQGASPERTTRATERPTLRSASPSLPDELSHLGSLKFTTRRQDAADESVFTDLPVTVTISHVVADAEQCHISYRRQLEREDSNQEEQHSFALGDIDELKVEPFESFENEHQGQPGWVYTLTDPEISAVVITHRDGRMDWFAVRAGAIAQRLREDIQRRGDYCRRHAAP